LFVVCFVSFFFLFVCFLSVCLLFCLLFCLFVCFVYLFCVVLFVCLNSHKLQVDEQKNYDPAAVDVFSYGMVLVDLLTNGLGEELRWEVLSLLFFFFFFFFLWLESLIRFYGRKEMKEKSPQSESFSNSREQSNYRESPRIIIFPLFISSSQCLLFSSSSLPLLFSSLLFSFSSLSLLFLFSFSSLSLLFLFSSLSLSLSLLFTRMLRGWRRASARAVWWKKCSCISQAMKTHENQCLTKQT